MKLYAGIDLHSNNNLVAIIDEHDKLVFKRRIPNQADVVIAELEPFRQALCGVVIESTYNWYWLVDALQHAGYNVHLANPAKIHRHKGLKHSDDAADSILLAHLLRVGLLATCHIYPEEERPVRDLLRKRAHLVQLRTSLVVSLQGTLACNCGSKLNLNKLKQTTADHVTPMLAAHEDLELIGRISKETIDYLTGKIRTIESAVKEKMTLRPSFEYLQTMPGIGLVLSMTIMLETGDVSRFPKVGNFTSYCRKVPTRWTSNDKQKGRGNKKNGNKYLAWAFSEAAELARRFNEHARTFYNRKAAETNFMVAHAALAHKLARAAYFIMRDGTVFEHSKLFA